MSRLIGNDLTSGYGGEPILSGLDVNIPDGSLTVIVGPNACGKSTLLRTMSRLLKPGSGHVMLDGKDIHRLSSRQVATTMGLLPQSSIAPDGITVTDLVGRGRYPHQSVFSQWSRRDQEAVGEALAVTGITDLAKRHVDELSGGQRQRVWIAMVLAQETPILLLDEPTTFLDIAHQVEVLQLVERLRRDGRTVVAVLHELNHAARFGTHLIAMRDGRIVAEGDPCDVLTAQRVEEVFDMPARVIADPDTGTPIVLPRI